MNLIFENNEFLVKADGFTRTYSDAAKAVQVFQMMADELIGYENAHKPEFEPMNDDQRNGVERWFHEQDELAKAQRAFDEGLILFA